MRCDVDIIVEVRMERDVSPLFGNWAPILFPLSRIAFPAADSTAAACSEPITLTDALGGADMPTTDTLEEATAV